MEKILIAGKNSYIGVSFERYLERANGYQIDTIDTKTDLWKSMDFSNYDVILNVAGIAHFNHGKITQEIKKNCHDVNTILAYNLAKKASESGVKQFIHISSMSVFGECGKMGELAVIDKNTKPVPRNIYGHSKFEAEKMIEPLQSSKFNIVIIRPPMVYGPNCLGNYVRLSKFARKLPVFPKVENQRSMIHIDNLCEFIRLIIKNNDFGTFMPQNKEYVNTSEMVKEIANKYGKKIILTSLFNIPLKMISYFIPMINKAFGNLTYDKSLSEYKEDYCVINFKDSIG